MFKNDIIDFLSDCDNNLIGIDRGYITIIVNRIEMSFVIKDMQTKEMLDSLDGVTAVVGDIETLPDVDPEKLVLVGVCAGKKKREGIRFAPGCAPRNYWVIEAITGIAQQSRGADLRSKTEQ